MFLRCDWRVRRRPITASRTNLLTTQRPSDIRHKLCKSEIRNFQMPICSEQNILRLQIPIHKTILMEVIQRERDLCRIEFRDGVWESLGFAEEGEEFAAGDKVHDHVEEGGIVECSPEVYEERMSDDC